MVIRSLGISHKRLRQHALQVHNICIFRLHLPLLRPVQQLLCLLRCGCGEVIRVLGLGTPRHDIVIRDSALRYARKRAS